MKLQCCMNLFGPALVADKCPENCAVQTKTKYSESLEGGGGGGGGGRITSCEDSYPFVSCVAAYYYGKKRKLSKPAGGEEEAAAEGEPAKPARRRKKRKAIFVLKKRRSSTVDYAPAGSPQVRGHASFALNVVAISSEGTDVSSLVRLVSNRHCL